MSGTILPPLSEIARAFVNKIVDQQLGLPVQELHKKEETRNIQIKLLYMQTRTAENILALQELYFDRMSDWDALPESLLPDKGVWYINDSETQIEALQMEAKKIMTCVRELQLMKKQALVTQQASKSKVTLLHHGNYPRVRLNRTDNGHVYEKEKPQVVGTTEVLYGGHIVEE